MTYLPTQLDLLSISKEYIYRREEEHTEKASSVLPRLAKKLKCKKNESCLSVQRPTLPLGQGPPLNASSIRSLNLIKKLCRGLIK